jgi:hypothetical protein
MVLVDPVKSPNEDELFGLTYVFWVYAEVDSGSVSNKVVYHCRSYYRKLVRKVNIAREIRLNFIDIDKVGELLYDCEVHVPHFLLGDIVHPLHCLKGMDDTIGIAVVDVEFFLQLVLHIVRVWVLPQKRLIIIQDLLILLHVASFCLLQAGLFLVVLMLIIEFHQLICDINDPFVGGIGICAFVIESLFISKVIALCSDSFEFKVSFAIPALRDNAADVAILLPGCDHERVNAYGWFPSGIILKHCKEYANIVDFAVFGLFKGEVKRAHDLFLRWSIYLDYYK